MKQLDQNNSDNSYQDDTIDLKDLFALLWNGRYLVILILFLKGVASVTPFLIGHTPATLSMYFCINLNNW